MASFFNRAFRKAAFLLVLPFLESFFFLHSLDYVPAAMVAWVVWVLLAERKNELVLTANLFRFLVHLSCVAGAVFFPVLGLAVLLSSLFVWISPRVLFVPGLWPYSILSAVAMAVRPLVVQAVPQLSAPFARSTSLIAFRLSEPFTSATAGLPIGAADAGLDAMLLIGLLLPAVVALGGKKLTLAAQGAFLGWAMLYIFIINCVRVAVLGVPLQWLVISLGVYGFFAGTRSVWLFADPRPAVLKQNPV